MFPIRDNTPRHSAPVITLLIILANAAVFFLETGLNPRQLQGFIELFGLVPIRYTHAESVGSAPYGYLPFLTSMFVHGGLFHIIVNMWTLWIFGDNVEDRMGGVRYAAFYFVCGIVAAAVHVYANPDSAVPVVGASGALAGVLGAYFIMFPRARLIMMIPIFFYPLFFEIPAVVYFLLWFFIQVYSGTMSLAVEQDAGGVAWFAHIGGFVTGVVLHRFFLIGRPKLRRLFADEHGMAGAWAEEARRRRARMMRR